MPRFKTAVCLLVLWWFSGWASAQAAASTPITLRDDSGHTLQLPAPPQRIVSLLPSLTETVCALKQCQRLVGVDRYSNWPAQVKALPQVGGGLDPNIEAIVALKPDVVLLATSSRAVQRLRALGVTVMALEPKSTRDAQRVMGLLGTALGVANAPALWSRLEADVNAVAQALPPRVRGLRVYYEVSSGGYAAGPQSFMGETMARLGLRNIVAPELGPFPRINPEYVVRADPDLIMIGERNAADLAQRPGWSGLRALRQQRVCVFSADESDVLVRPGPRMAEAARLMARCVNEKGGP